MEPRTCTYEPCAEPLTGRHPNVRYCTPEHKSAAYSERKLRDRHEKMPTRVCKRPGCGNVIEDKKHPRTVFCTGECQRLHLSAEHTAKRTARRTAARSGRFCAAPGCENEIPPERTAGASYCSDECHRDVVLAWRKENAPAYMRQYLYGITEDQWVAQLAAQGYRCAICRSDRWPGKDNSPHADHDHSLPVFVLRGALCGNENNGLDSFDENVISLAAAIRYLMTAVASPDGRAVPCDDRELLASAVRFLADGDPELLKAADFLLERAGHV